MVHNATAMSPTSFVGLGAAQLVDQIEDVIQRLADVLNIVLIVFPAHVHVRQVTDVFVQALNGARQIIDDPAAKESRHTQNDVEKNLHVIHVTSPIMPAW